MQRPESYVESAILDAEKARDEVVSKAKGPGAAGKPRRRSFAYRIEPEDAERIANLARELKTPQDALMRALVPAMLEAVERGLLTLSTENQDVETWDSKGRFRTWTKKSVLWSWTRE